ncbi:MAG TPA: DoxX family protein [Candidatus Kapabacteria bacterium]|nr:DoxX family protein [Candidatus Kapabacteria bacterium]
MSNNISSKWQSYSPYILSLLRIFAALVFMQPGAMKLFGWPAPLPNGITISLFSQMGLAGVLEVFGGALLLVGLFTRPVAFILSGEMAVAYFQGHFSHGFWTVVNHGEPAVLLCFIWLFISAAGAGPWSIDAMRRK